MTIKETVKLPGSLRGRSIHENVIPTVCNLKNMLNKLISVQGDYAQLKQWEKRSYQAYQIERIKPSILTAPPEKYKDIIKSHILNCKLKDLGASCIDIYLVAYVAETYGAGKSTFFNYIKQSGISEKENTAQAIWQVGKGDGVYLEILNDDGTIRDWNFIVDWIKGNGGFDSESIASHDSPKVKKETNWPTIHTQEKTATDSVVVRIIKEKLNESGGKAVISLFNGDSCEIGFSPNGTGLLSPKIPPANQLRWEAFDAAVEVVVQNGGKAAKGKARTGARLGSDDLPLDSVEGFIASKVHDVQMGETAFGPSFVIAAVLDWAGICHNERGYLTINRLFLNQI